MIRVPFIPPRSAQIRTEFRALLRLAVAHKVRSYLEIGAYRGGTFYRVMKQLPPGSRGVVVDLPGAKWGKSGTERSLARVVDHLSRLGYPMELILGDSAEERVIARVAELAPFDLILIDGDHTYDGVKHDWENYGHLGRIVAFHDIAGDKIVNRDGHPVDVPGLWEEIKQRGYATREFIANGSRKGIGVIELDTAHPADGHRSD